MHLDEELQHALAAYTGPAGFSQQCWNGGPATGDWEQMYPDNWASSGVNERLPSVGTAFSFSRSFAVSSSQFDNSNSCQTYQYQDGFSAGQYQDEEALLCFPAILQQSQQSQQAVDDFDLSLIR